MKSDFHKMFFYTLQLHIKYKAPLRLREKENVSEPFLSADPSIVYKSGFHGGDFDEGSGLIWAQDVANLQYYSNSLV